MPAKKSTPASDAAPATPAAAKKAAKKAPAKKAAAKKAPAKQTAAAATAPQSQSPASPSQQEIAHAAYLNYRSRKERGLPGDQHGDWLEAERRLKGK